MIHIRSGEPKDYPAVLQQIKDLALFEKAPEQVTNTVEQMELESQHFTLFVAENEDKRVVGFAICFFAYYTWVGKSLYLDDLYIEPEYRGQKIGKRLLNEVFKLAKEENCKRLRWQVLDWNSDAIDVYNHIGAKLDSEWINCDFDKQGIAEWRIK
jgi:GNAT superfamily N-acetyltransferase